MDSLSGHATRTFPVFKKLTGWALQLLENKKGVMPVFLLQHEWGSRWNLTGSAVLNILGWLSININPNTKKSACSVAGDHTWHTGSTANVPVLLGEPSCPVLPSNTLYLFWQKKEALLDVNFRTPSMSRPPGIILGNSRQKKGACLLLNDQRRN